TTITAKVPAAQKSQRRKSNTKILVMLRKIRQSLQEKVTN
ncbi:36752_t:CDS:1, partial [Racocetra persica]